MLEIWGGGFGIKKESRVATWEGLEEKVGRAVRAMWEASCLNLILPPSWGFPQQGTQCSREDSIIEDNKPLTTVGPI